MLWSEISFRYRGIGIDEEHWGKGIATEAFKECILLAKEVLCKESVYAVVDFKNSTFQHILRKLGYPKHSLMDDLYYVKTGLVLHLLLL